MGSMAVSHLPEEDEDNDASVHLSFTGQIRTIVLADLLTPSTRRLADGWDQLISCICLINATNFIKSSRHSQVASQPVESQ
jgi:hypothetical protein